jgi:hypothetical protein
MYLKQITQDQQSKLLNLIAKMKNGASIDELEAYAGLGLPRRTLQRRINTLVSQGALRVTGQTRATRYHAITPPSYPQTPLLEHRDGQATLPHATFHPSGSSYINLDRRFSTFLSPESEAGDDYIAPWQFDSSLSWDQVLKKRCSIILAEGGAGKTAEFRNQALIRRAHDKLAFFCRLELLVTSPLADCLEIGAPEELGQWQSGTTHAYFFLDSVDEAKIARIGDFERAVLNFIGAIESHKDRCSIVISARPAAWQTVSDAEMLCRRLHLRAPRQTDEIADGERDPDAGTASYDRDTPLHDATENSKGDENRPALAVLQMAPLNPDQIKAFAAECGVTDVGAFWNSLKNNDAEAFATRPADLPGLIGMWRRSKRIGSYTEVIEENLRLKLLESNRYLQDPISTERARQGAEILAAAPP